MIRNNKNNLERFNWGILAYTALLLTMCQLFIPSASAATLTQVNNFGHNPGNLGMYVYIQDGIEESPTLLVAVHWCGGSAQDLYNSGQFRSLADQHRFIVIFPSSDASDGCFDVATQAALTRNGGSDPTSIMSMVTYAIQYYGVDHNRVYAAGISSGAMMTNVLLGLYPNIFKAGAAFAGVPFGCFATTNGAFWNSNCANGSVIRGAQEWGDLSRNQNPGYRGPWPRMQLWHGTDDEVLNFANFGEEIKQWTNIHGLSQTPVYTDNPQPGYTRTRYGSSGSSANVEAIRMAGVAHNLPVNVAEAIRFFGIASTSIPPVSGSCGSFPYCANGHHDDPDGDGWGWTGSQSCIVVGSQPDTCGGSSSSASGQITLRARGTSGTEHINLRVGGSVVGSWALSTSYRDYTYTGSATGEIQVQFDNDGTTRDVQVDYIRVNGETRQAEDQSLNTGVWANGRCGGTGHNEWLHCNGHISFGSFSTSSSAASSSAGGGTASCVADPSVQLATSIPQAFWQSPANGGTMRKVSYPVHYYTNQTSGGPGDLPRQGQAITKEFNIYLPPNYSENESYPLVIVLHGITDNEDTWIGSRSNPRPKAMLDALIAAGEIQPLIAVFPNTCASSNFRNCGFHDQAGYYYFDNELIKDLVPFLESNYAVTTDRSCRGLAGFSMGGMQTINLGVCRSLAHFASFAPLAAAPTSYSASSVAQCIAAQNQAASYPINFFYNSHGASDGTSQASHWGAVNGLKENSPYLSDENFAYHTVPGGHDYPPAMIGLYNFLRIAFPK